MNSIICSSGPMAVARHIVKDEGVAALWKGLVCTFFADSRISPKTACPTCCCCRDLLLLVCFSVLVFILLLFTR
jgi:hypothetical protein